MEWTHKPGPLGDLYFYEDYTVVQHGRDRKRYTVLHKRVAARDLPSYDSLEEAKHFVEMHYMTGA